MEKEKRKTAVALREMLREQLCCLGRIAVRHQVPDDVIWDLTKGLDVIYERFLHRLEETPTQPESLVGSHRTTPHPGISYLLSKLDAESAAPTDASGGGKRQTFRSDRQH